MTKLLVFSDPHITSEGQTIIGLDTLARFETSLKAALRDHGDAAAVILLGDLTHYREVDAYLRLQHALRTLPCPVIPMLGNHDQRANFLQVFDAAPQNADGFIASAHVFGDHHLITLDTLDGPPYPAGHHSGWLCDDRLAWLDAALQATQGAPTLVCSHHPPCDTGVVGIDAIKLRNGDALLSRLAAHGACYLLCGHLHRTVSGLSAGVPWTLLKSTAHQGPLDLVNADSSLSIDEPPGYGVVLFRDDAIIVHHQDVLPVATIFNDTASRTQH